MVERAQRTAPEGDRDYWRSPAEDDSAIAAAELAAIGAEAPALSRRRFLQLLGASAALAGAGCFRSPVETIVPYVERPPEVTPGVPSAYATSFELDGFGTGVVVASR